MTHKHLKPMGLNSRIVQPRHPGRDKKQRTPIVGNRVTWRGAMCLWPLIAALTVLPAETADAAVDGLVFCAPETFPCSPSWFWPAEAATAFVSGKGTPSNWR